MPRPPRSYWKDGWNAGSNEHKRKHDHTDPTRWITAAPAHAGRTVESADRGAAHPRAEIRQAHRPAPGPEENPGRGHRRQPVHRTLNAYARVIRARGQAAG